MQAAESLCIVQANFHQLWGGQAEVVLSLSKSLARRGHRVTVATPPGSELENRAREAGLEVFTGCTFRKGAFFSLLKDALTMGRFLRDQRADVFHCHGSQDHWTGALGVRRFGLRTRIVRTRHNIYPVKNHVFNRWLFRKSTAQVITIFGDQGRYFTGTGLLKPESLFTLHSPLPQEFVNPGTVRRSVREELNLDDGAPLIGFAANFHPDKAPLDFVAMAERISKPFPESHFAMAGHGPLDVPIREQIRKLGLEERFHILGFRKDILNVMASFDLFALTSVTREASSTVVKQAGALGIPVVATDVGGTREILEDGKTGFLVQPGDVDALTAAIGRLLSDPPRAAAMGAAGKEKVLREFTAAAIAEKTEALYRRVLAPGLQSQIEARKCP